MFFLVLLYYYFWIFFLSRLKSCQRNWTNFISLPPFFGPNARSGGCDVFIRSFACLRLHKTKGLYNASIIIIIFFCHVI